MIVTPPQSLTTTTSLTKVPLSLDTEVCLSPSIYLFAQAMVLPIALSCLIMAIDISLIEFFCT